MREKKTMAGCSSREIGFVEESLGFESGGRCNRRRLKFLFDEFLGCFLNEFGGISCRRVLQALIGEGREIDLLKLYYVVRNRGGCCCGGRIVDLGGVGLWFELEIGAALKSFYDKYLDALVRKVVVDRSVERVGFGSIVVELGSDLGVLPGFPALEFNRGELGSGDEDMDNVSVESGGKDGDGGCSENAGGKECVDHPATDDDYSVSRKRKRESYSIMLNWVRGVARNPCSRAVECLPKMSKWKGYDSELEWKQVLSARETMQLKRNHSSSQQSVWKKQKMHPSLYEDDRSSSGGLRSSQRLLLAKDAARRASEQSSTTESPSSGFQSEEDASDKQSDSSAKPASYWEKHRQKRVSIGQQSQTELPEFYGASYESDPKWLGTKAWPLEKGENKEKLIERDPIGKGRQDSCGCQLPGSCDCIRFHVQEKRLKVKIELGPAFGRWEFHRIGEDVAHLWTETDQKKFQDIVESNRLSSQKYFWDELFKSFPQKGREALVSYYFNVFLLRRRAEQNRSGKADINSDDEDSEYGPVANKFGAQSIFCSPKKPLSR